MEEHSLFGTIGTFTLSFMELVDAFSVRPQPATYNLSPTEAVSGGVGRQIGLMYSKNGYCYCFDCENLT